MAFNDEKRSTGRKVTWSNQRLSATSENPITVQLLEPDVTSENKAQVIWKHYIPQARRKNGGRGISILCPGYNVCPICQRNAELGDKKHRDYIAAQRKFVVNVLDWTVRKVCPLCQTENYGSKCSYDDNDLREVKPEPPVVKLLEGSRSLFSELSTREQETRKLDENGNEVVIGWTHYPIRITTTGEQREPIYTTTALAENDVDAKSYEKDFISVEDAYVILNATEIQELLAGGSLSDVLKARYESGEKTKAEDSIGDLEEAL